MVDLAQLLFSGLRSGAVYGLVGVGFVAIFAVTGIINLAQGEFAVLAAFVAISAVDAGLPLPVAALAGVLAVAVCAVVVERVAIAPAAGSTTVAYIILTLGVSIALKAAVLLVWGADGRGLPPVAGGTMQVGGVVIRPQDLAVFAGTGLVAAALYLFFERTVTGKAFRACAEQRVAARLVGISPARMSRLAFALAGVVAGLAGILVSPIELTNWNSGLFLGLKGFVAASLAGMVSIPGAILGGLLLGVVESLSGGYVSSGLKDAVAFFILLVVLVLRPGGVFTRQAEARV
jgi:branched-chain amino acid transport system permease protein